MQLNVLVGSFVVSAAVTGGVAVVAWRRRRLVGARTLALLMLALSWWLLANALEAAAVDRSAKVFWSVVAYPGIELAPVLYLLFVLAWTRQDGSLSTSRVALLLLVPIVSVGIAATNDWHHLIWTSVTLIDAWGVTAVYEHGPWFLVEAAYAYALVAVGLVALVVALYRFPGAYSTRIRLVFFGSLVPVAASVLYVAGLDSVVHADLSSIAFAISGIIAAWAVLRFSLLDIVPVAWPTLVDALADAVLVLDPGRRIAAVNQSAARLLGVGGEAVGQPIDAALFQFPVVVALCREPGDQEAEVSMSSAQPMLSSPEPTVAPCEKPRWFSVRVTPIEDGRRRNVGSLVVLRDVTERREMDETIRTLALTDELTGLLNRRGFSTLAEQQMRTAARTRNRLWLLFADIDGLKEINDRLGHEAGDRALCEVAELLRGGLFREADLVARLGGDEFAILATEVSPTDGTTVMMRVNEAVRKASEAPGREYTLSVSSGISVFDPEMPQTLDELIDDADRRMYRAKQSQRTAPAVNGPLVADAAGREGAINGPEIP